MEFSVLGALAVRAGDGEIPVGGAKRRALLCLLLLNANRVTPAERLIEHLWEGDPPDTAASTLQSHVYNLRRALGADRLQTRGTGYVLEVREGELDAAAFEADLARGQEALAAGDAAAATKLLLAALARWRGPAYDEVAGASWVIAAAARLEEARVVALETLLDARLAEGAPGDVVGRAEAAVAEHPLRERLWVQLMTALYREGRQAEALRAYQRVRTLLAEELGIEPGAELRAIEQAVLSQDPSLGPSAAQAMPSPAAVGSALPSGVVTFLLTDIVGSSRMWEVAGAAMPDALRRHGEAVAAAVAAHDGILLKPRGEGDSTFSVFRRASDGAAAALEAQARLDAETWPEGCELTVRMALHTGEAFERDGDFFGPALNRAARIRSIATGGQILVSQALAELVQDHLPAGATLRSLGHRELRDLSRGEHVYELSSATASVDVESAVEGELGVAVEPDMVPLVLPDLPPTLVPTGPFVGRAGELERLSAEWDQATTGSPRAAVVGGEPGVGKTRLAAEQARSVHDAGGLVLYGRCDEDLGAPYQPFVEALRTLLPCVGADRLRALRGVEELGRLVPEVADLVGDLGPPTRTDSETERYALFDAVARLLGSVSAEAPVLLVLDDLQWASKPTLLLLRHLLRNAEHARLQLIATYRTTDLDPAHPLASTLADLHRDGTAIRVVLAGLGEQDVTAYLDATGYEDEDLATALLSVTSGNPFFLIEVLRHLDETGGRWDPSTLPQGVREAVGRRLARLSGDGNDALLAGAVIGARFALDLVERVVGRDLVEAVSEACDAELIVEEPGGWFRFNHALVRRSLLASVPSVKRVRLHQRIADELEARNGDDGAALAELAHHYFESAWAGNAVKAIEYCRRAADQAMADVAYEAAADFYDRALQAMDIDDRPADDAERAEVLLAGCEALLAAGDVAGATDAVARLEDAASGSPRLAAWATCFAGQLAVLTHPDQLTTIEGAVAAAAEQLAAIGDDAGEAKAHTVRAFCLARLGRYADCETTLDRALTAARQAGDHRRVNAVLAGAPLAALWGPSPVARAGGRCLDVIRLLRITTGSPAVEATSVRCQAVLEAFRGRAHAARRMLESARRTLAELGLRHALYEVDLFVGIVELVDAKPQDAEVPLRRAFNGFRRMGVDADAAQAAALLARAYLEVHNDFDADEVCGESERLAGHDLKASIAWRAARAQLLSRRGDHAAARELADAAVALADRTDAFVDHGDAYTVLARVLEAAGDVAGATRAAEAGIALYERKGAVALADLTRRFILPGAPLDIARNEHAPPPRPPGEVRENAATRAFGRYFALWNQRDWQGLEAVIAEDVVNHDRRSGLQDVLEGREAWIENNRLSAAGEGTLAYTPIATRADHLCVILGRWQASGDSAGAPEVEFILFGEVDVEGRISYQAVFDRGDIDGAYAQLDARFRAGSRAENAAVRAFSRWNVLFNDQDWDGMAALVSDEFVSDDRRSGVRLAVLGREEYVQSARTAQPGSIMDSTWVATRGDRLALRHQRWRAAPDPGSPELEFYEIVSINTDGLMDLSVLFDMVDLDAALAELDALYASGPVTEPGVANTATVIDQRWMQLYNERDWDGHRALIAYEFLNDDRRRGVRLIQTREEHLEAIKIGEVAGGTFDASVIATRGDRVALIRQRWRSTEEPGAPEMSYLKVITVAEGRLVGMVMFEPDDLDAALAELEVLYEVDQAAHSKPLGAELLRNAATDANARWCRAFNARDWQGLAGVAANDLVSEDRRAGIRTVYDRAQHLESTRTGDRPGATLEVTVVATRGTHLALVEQRWLAAQESGAPEVTTLLVIEARGTRLTRNFVFDADDFDGAFDVIDSLYLDGEGAPFEATLTPLFDSWAAYNARNWERYRATFADDMVLIDHHSASMGTIADPDEAVRALQTMVDLVPGMRGRGLAVLAVDHGAATLLFGTQGATPEGVTVDTGSPYVTQGVKGGRVSWFEIFPEDGRDAALARFEQLRAGPMALENVSSRARRRAHELLVARDWAALGELYREDAIDHDRRRLILTTTNGREAIVEAYRATQTIGMTRIDEEVLAVRGERLALIHTRGSGEDQSAGAFEGHVLEVSEVDESGLFVGSVFFDQDAIEAAYEELERRYLVSDAAPFAKTWRSIADTVARVNREGVPALPDSYLGVDHRALPLPDGNPGSWVPLDVMSGVGMRVTSVIRLADHGAVIRMSTEARSADEVAASWVMLAVITVGDTGRIELFPESDLDAAVARFDELRPSSGELTNTASRAFARLNAAVVARDWKHHAELLRPDFVGEDRRRHVQLTFSGREAIAEFHRAIPATGVTSIEVRVIALRGDRLSLAYVRGRGSDRGSGAFEGDALHITEVDDDGLIAWSVGFDGGAQDAAFAELEARYLAGEAAPFADVCQAFIDGVERLNRGDPSAAPPGMRIVDHRPASFDHADVPDAVRGMAEVVPDAWARIAAVHRLDEHGGVATIVREGTTDDGFSARWSLIIVADGHTYAEVFADDQLGAALARFEELRPASEELANAASRARSKWNAGIVRSDWARYVELLDPDIVVEDRRSYVHHTLNGRDAAVDYDRGLPAMGVTHIETRTVATRGDRLALSYIQGGGTDRGSGAYEGDALQITELGPDGRIVVAMSFDGDAEDAAFAELEERYVAREAAPLASTWRQIGRIVDRLNAHDLSLFGPDNRRIDHRPASFPAQRMETTLQTMIELVPDWTARIVAVHRLEKHGVVVALRSGGTSTEGVEVAWSVLVVIKLGHEARSEVFPEDSLDAAIARFEELRPTLPELSNAATRARARSTAAILARDWRPDASPFHEDAVVDDRRSYSRLLITGRDAIVTYLRGVADMGVTRMEERVLALRGDRLSLTLVRGGGTDRGSGAYEGDALQIAEVDAKGLIVRSVNYDGDALDAAYAELDARYLSGEAAPLAHVWRPIVESIAAISRHDLGEVPKVIVTDHTQSWMPTGDPDLSLNPLFELVPDLAMRITAVYRLEERGAVFLVSMEGTDQQGAHVTWANVSVVDRTGRTEIFPDGELDAALARFDELGSAGMLENAASRVHARWLSTYMAGDWDACRATLHQDPIVEDGRSLVGHTCRGREAVIEYLRGIIAMGVTHTDVRVLAVRGDRLALAHINGGGTDRGSGAYEGEALTITEVGADGLIAYQRHFDGDALDAAYDELDGRYLEGEASRHAHIWRPVVDSTSAINRHDVDAMTDTVMIDHSGQWMPTGSPTAITTALIELVPDLSMRIPAVYRLDGRGAVFAVHLEGTDLQGGHVAWSVISTVGRDGISEVFADDQLDAVIERFEAADQP